MNFARFLRLKATLPTAALLLAASALWAQDEPAPAPAEDGAGDDEIVVTAPTMREHYEVRSQARRMLPPSASVAEPLARFQKPICPGVMGLDLATARLVIDRIMFNAREAGLTLDETEGCAANVLVGFVTDPAAELVTIDRADHVLLDGLSYWEKKRVHQQEGPVRAWTVTSVRNNAGIAGLGEAPQVEATNSSRRNLAMRRDMELSVVVFALDAIAGMDAVTLADYATMRALTGAEPPEGEPPWDTVLTLFANEAAPERLTAFDRAYLRTIYESPPSAPVDMALAGLGDRLAEELAR